nr:MAG TPA: tail protein [Caudoviricetes sp.]
MSLSGNTTLLTQLGSILANKAAGGVDLPTLQNPGDADKLLAGYQLIDQSGQAITGTIPSKAASDLTASGATVTVPAGYYPAQVSKSVATATQATPSVTVDSGGKITATASQAAGYVAAGTKSATKQLTVQAAKTWTPGTSNQTLASGRYLTGTQTIKGDANLKAANIVKGVSIFGVTGTAETGGGGGGSDADLDALIADTITSVTSQATSVRDRAFSSCTSVVSINLPAAKTIGKWAFMQCAKLATVNLPEATTLESSAFSSCPALTSVTIPKVTSLPSQGLYNCTALQKIDLPAVTSISDSVFMMDSKLTAVILRSATLVTLSNKSAFSSSGISAGTGYIYVPSSLVASYKTATNWATYAAQIRAIEDYPDITGG